MGPCTGKERKTAIPQRGGLGVNPCDAARYACMHFLATTTCLQPQPGSDRFGLAAVKGSKKGDYAPACLHSQARIHHQAGCTACAHGMIVLTS